METASDYQYDSQCRRCGKLEYFCKCEDYYEQMRKRLAKSKPMPIESQDLVNKNFWELEIDKESSGDE